MFIRSMRIYLMRTLLFLSEGITLYFKGQYLFSGFTLERALEDHYPIVAEQGKNVNVLEKRFSIIVQGERILLFLFLHLNIPG